MKNFIQKTSLMSFIFVLFMASNFEAKSQVATLSVTDPTHPSVTVDEMKTNPEKNMAQFFSVLSPDYEITSFNIIVARKVGESLPGVRVQGNNLDEKSLELISTILIGDKIIIDNIKGEKDGLTKNLKYLVIDVK